VIRIRMDGASLVIQALEAISLQPAEMTQMLHELGNAVVDQTRLRFVDQASPAGVPWVKSLRAQVQGGQTLRDTGRLMNSFTYNVIGNSVEVGTSLPYAAVHQFGAHIQAVNGPYLRFRLPNGQFCQVGSVDIPARPFMGFSDTDRQELADIVADYLRI
jgi:phage gpG-like protein